VATSKTNKSFKKRLKLTKKGKVIQRHPGMGHFNAKESRAKQLTRKRAGSFNLKGKDLNKFLPFK